MVDSFTCLIIMLLLGFLSAVRDLRATSGGISVTISWSPPFSLIPDIWYSVFIYNVTDENNPTGILCTDCTNITETHYTFTPDYTTSCQKFFFSIIPINGAGQGEKSGNVTGYALNGIVMYVRFYTKNPTSLDLVLTVRICISAYKVKPWFFSYILACMGFI